MSDNNPRLASALSLASQGLRVVPLHHPLHTGKKAICSCNKCGACAHIGKHPRYDPRTLPHGAHSATSNAAQLAEWWRVWPEANVGLAVGPSVGLLALDIDPRNGGDDTFSDLLAEFGPLPATVEALTGGGGRHLLFIHPGGEVRGTLGPGVDVVASDGNLIVVEPSLHKSGNRYAWELSSAPGVVAVAELPQAWKERIFVPARVGDGGESLAQGLQGEQGQRGIQGSLPTGVDPAIPVTPDPAWDMARVLREAHPTGRGQHDHLNLKLARLVKFHLRLVDLEQARAVFDQWWERARPYLHEQDYDVAWSKFGRAHELARIPVGASGMADLAHQEAMHSPLPKCADVFRNDRTRRLVGTCKVLAGITGGTFKLSCHQVGALFGCKPAVAWELFRALERAGILLNVDRGRPGRPGANAAEWKYLGD